MAERSQIVTVAGHTCDVHGDVESIAALVAAGSFLRLTKGEGKLDDRTVILDTAHVVSIGDITWSYGSDYDDKSTWSVERFVPRQLAHG